MAKVLRKSFQPILMELLPDLMQYADADRDIYDNQTLVGLLADAFKYEPSLMNDLLEKLMPWLFESIN